MFDYSNLNDVEFERLCSDIMQRKLNIKLRNFAAGKDGGIDLVDDLNEKNVVVQVKHYDKSDYYQLKNHLKNEIEKVEKINPKEYYVFTSMDLTVGRVQEIYNIFSDYMKSDKNILTKNELDDFLNDENNLDILRTHFKLWFTSDIILKDLLNENIVLDGEVLLSDIEEEFKYFVETRLFHECINILNEDRKILIYGNPGVGKTINSKMLALYFVKKDYKIRYTSNGDISDLKKSLTSNKELKEVIFLDDCLGQYYFNLKDNQDHEIIDLIKHVKMYKNKIIILNSRVTILNEATNRSEEFYSFFSNNKVNLKQINMSSISSKEKALIFYNHLLRNEIPKNYYYVIRKNKNYKRIINHKNYSPRIIEYVTTRSRYEYVEKEYYFQYILNNLNNPQDVWKNEYNTRLQHIDRLFINTLFSLTDTYIDINILKECFLGRIQNEDIDTTINVFNSTLNRLTKSLVKIYDNNGKKMVSVLNGSVNDYLTNIISENELELRKIRESALYIEQIFRSYNVKSPYDFFLNKVKNGSIEQFKSTKKNEVTKVIQHLIATEQLLKENYRNIILDFGFINGSSPLDMRVNKHFLISSFLGYNNLYEFYEIKGLLKNKDFIKSTVKYLTLNETVSVLNQINQRLEDEDENFLIYHELFEELIQDAVNEYIEDLDYSDFITTISENEQVQSVMDDIERDATHEIEEVLDEIQCFDKSNISIDIIVDELIVEELIKDYIGEESNYMNEFNFDNHDDVDAILDREIGE
ncbi:nSTAND3 domain-containing NTPase [Salibacterium aidingense]|uniref:nSTAND3 domain-containing NTPase n=1 Tax=Salibacterium aidingense TaxID=384933 RepID=UPI003BEA796F